MRTNMHQSLAFGEQFGAEAAYGQAVELNNEISISEIELANATDRLRRAKARIEERESEIEYGTTIDATGADEKVSQAAIDRKVKFAKAADEELKALNIAVLDIASEVDRHAACLSGQKTAHKTVLARIHGLDGWFQYLAAVKQANTHHEAAMAATPF